MVTGQGPANAIGSRPGHRPHVARGLREPRGHREGRTRPALAARERPWSVPVLARGAVSFAHPAHTRVRTRRLDVWEGTHHHRRMPLGHGRGRRDFHFLLCRLFSVNGLDNKQWATFVIEKVRRRSGC